MTTATGDGRLIYVEWVHSAAGNVGWMTPAELSQAIQDAKHKIITVGVLIDLTTVGVVVASGVDEEGNSYSPVIIPWPCITLAMRFEPPSPVPIQETIQAPEPVERFAANLQQYEETPDVVSE